MTDFFLESLKDDNKKAKPQSAKEVELFKIFDEKPVSLEEFITNKEYLGKTMGNARLSPIQYEAVKHFIQVLRPQTYRLMAECWGDAYEPTRNVNNLAIAWGKGSG